MDNQKIDEIEKAAEEWRWTKYKNICETVIDLELQLKYFEDEDMNKMVCKDQPTNCMQDLQIQKLKIQRGLEIRKGEKKFLASLLTRL